MTEYFRKTKGLGLFQLLDSRTKAELMDIVRVLEFPGYKGMMKGAIVDKLTTDLSVEFNTLLQHIDGQVYDYLYYLASHKGLALAENFPGITGVNLMYLGMVFRVMIDDVRMFAMPYEFVEIFNSSDTDDFYKTVTKNQGVVQLAQGLLSRYGVLETEVLFGMINGYLKESIDEEELYMILRISGVINELIEVDTFYCNHTLCEDIRSVILGAMEFRELDYKRFTFKEILKYSIIDYYENTPELIRFKVFIHRHIEIDEETLDRRILYLLLLYADNISIDEIVEFLLGEFKELPRNAFEEFSKIITDLNNTTGKWALKGYSSDEILELKKNKNLSDDAANRPKLTLIKGRNNKLCPCGSGKLHKDCCGRR
ncbi:MAG: SEC-C domain-containing protein [Bacteroidales bacterium]|nr:SEC-C domain-containing protein [Bacteroidales bacterium]